jgi:broad specificity phosphatase PhoE
MLILARHGQTTANASGLLLGRMDPDLTELGQRQAMALAGAVTDADRVVCSPLGRARATAKYLDLPAVIDARWIEVDYGIYDGAPLRDVPHEVWERWRADPEFVPPGGESLADVGRRVREACAELADEVKERNVVVVSHVSPIKAAVAWALGVGDEVVLRMFLDLASVCRVAIGDRGPALRTFNDTAHLAALHTTG